MWRVLAVGTVASLIVGLAPVANATPERTGREDAATYALATEVLDLGSRSQVHARHEGGFALRARETGTSPFRYIGRSDFPTGRWSTRTGLAAGAYNMIVTERSIWSTPTGSVRKIRRLLHRPNARFIRDSGGGEFTINLIGSGVGLAFSANDVSDLVDVLVGSASSVQAITKRATPDGRLRYDLRTASFWRRLALVFRDGILEQVLLKQAPSSAFDLSYGRQRIPLPKPSETVAASRWGRAEDYVNARRDVRFVGFTVKSQAEQAIHRDPRADPVLLLHRVAQRTMQYRPTPKVTLTGAGVRLWFSNRFGTVEHRVVWDARLGKVRILRHR